MASFLDAAEASGEIEPCDFKGLAGGLYTDYLAGVVAYWLADESEGFADTAQLVDLSLAMLVLVLRAGLVNRLMQLGGFVLRSQMARMLQHGSGLLGMLQMASHTLECEAAAPRRRTAPPPPEPPAAKPRKPRAPRSPKAAA